MFTCQNPAKYPRQKVMVIGVARYAYLVPFIDTAARHDSMVKLAGFQAYDYHE